MSAWIETVTRDMVRKITEGRTLMSAWIETFLEIAREKESFWSHSHECVD